MVCKFQIEPGRVWGERDGTVFFDTDAYPVQYSTAALSVTGYSLVFPDFRKGNAYCWQQWDSGNVDNDPRESAISLITMPNQEWGPASTSPTDGGTQLDDVVLGTVPAETDHILVRLKATRTVNPSQINGNTIPPELEPGVWTIAYGGTVPFEHLYPIGRMIHVYLADTDNGDGTRNVLLRRLMTVSKVRQGFYRSGNDYNKTGWNYGGTYGSVYGIPVAMRDSRPATTDVTGVGGRFKRTGPSPAATNDNTNYSSTYTVDFEIIPGRSNITPVSGGSGSDPFFVMVDEQAEENVTASTHTVTIQTGEPSATRNIIVGVELRATATRDITSVTIGGVTATQVVYRRSTSATGVFMTGVYIASVPTGTSANVVVTTNGTSLNLNTSCFAGYNMVSTTPDGTISSGTLNTNTNLTTASGGFALAVGINEPGSWFTISSTNQYERYLITGLDNPQLMAELPVADSGLCYSRTFGDTDGTTKVMQYRHQDANGNPYAGNAAWCAASFH